jgi:hypothetical protein
MSSRLFARTQVSYDMASQAAAPPKLWSAEQPVLYTLVLELLSQDGSLVEAESCQVSISLQGLLSVAIVTESKIKMVEVVGQAMLHSCDISLLRSIFQMCKLPTGGI